MTCEGFNSSLKSCECSYIISCLKELNHQCKLQIITESSNCHFCLSLGNNLGTPTGIFVRVRNQHERIEHGVQRYQHQINKDVAVEKPLPPCWICWHDDAENSRFEGVYQENEPHNASW